MSRRRSIFAAPSENRDNLKQLDELSNEIDQNLRSLALVYPLSDTAKPLLKKVKTLQCLLFVGQPKKNQLNE